MKSKELGKERIGSKRIVNKDHLDEASESIKEISIVREKSHTLHWDNKKRSPRASCHSLKDLTCGSKNSFGRRKPGLDQHVSA